jgi:LacI family gluconate utilization system Gnt-I transcriptional repressor
MLPALTTVRTPRGEIGSAAAAMLLALINGQPVAVPRVDLGYQLITRSST